MLSFSVVTPTLGESRFYAEAIDSVSGQLSGDAGDEHLVVTTTEDRSGFLATQLANPPRVIAAAPRGAADAFNQGLTEVKGDLIGCLPDDDVYLPGALDRVREIFRTHPEIDVVYGGLEQIDEDSVAYRKRLPRPISASRLRRRNPTLPPSLFFRRSFLDDIGLLDASLAYHYWYDFVLRGSLAGKRFYRVKECLSGKRRHRKNRQFRTLDTSESVDLSFERIQMLIKHYDAVPASAALDLAHWQAEAEGHDPLTRGYDSAVLRNAATVRLTPHLHPGKRRLDAASGPDGHVSSGQVSSDQNGKPTYRRDLRLSLVHFRNQTRHAIKYPRAITRFLPGRVGPGLRAFFRSRLFQLKQHAPRASRLLCKCSEKPASEPLTIGIVTPNLNSADFLERTIRSVLDQDYPSLQYVVQDGQSRDHSVEVIKRYADRLHHWDSRQDTGQTQAINRGMKHLDAEVMAYLNSDDILLPGSLSYVSEYFRRNPDVDVIYGHRLIIDGDDQEIGRWILPPHDDHAIMFADYIPQETMFWRRSAWDAVEGSLDESFQFAMDWDLILRFRAAGMKFVRVPRLLGAFRVIETQKTQVLLETAGMTEMNRLRNRELGRIPTSREMNRAIRPYRFRQWVQHHAHSVIESTLG
jgi:glycosyltransferase involved in cell wall biosynthesis